MGVTGEPPPAENNNKLIVEDRHQEGDGRDKETEARTKRATGMKSRGQTWRGLLNCLGCVSSFVHSFIHSFDRHLSSIYYVLRPEDLAATMTSHRLTFTALEPYPQLLAHSRCSKTYPPLRHRHLWSWPVTFKYCLVFRIIAKPGQYQD